MSVDVDMPAAQSPLYARFSRRLRGIVIDWMIAMAAIFGAVLLAISVGSDSFSRALGFLVIAALLLYEPVLVSFTGGTLGHNVTNLRVVDDRSGGNLSFLKACARFVIKGVLGWYSFVILAATRRNQAIHDLLTRSTVQIRDPAKARPGQYIAERVELAASGMPSRRRRTVVTGILLLSMFFAFTTAIDFITAAGMLSHGCLNSNFCSGGERTAILLAAIMFLVTTAVIIALGWRGRLLGARKI